MTISKYIVQYKGLTEEILEKLLIGTTPEYQSKKHLLSSTELSFLKLMYLLREYDGRFPGGLEDTTVSDSVWCAPLCTYT
jgi:hypothetical protein